MQCDYWDSTDLDKYYKNTDFTDKIFNVSRKDILPTGMGG